MNELKIGQVIFLKQEKKDNYNTESPHIINQVDKRYPNRKIYQSEAFSGDAWAINLEEDDFKVAEVDSLPEEYVDITKKSIELSNQEEVDLYEATGIQLFTGKDLVESAYDEWSDFFSLDEEFTEYMESLGQPLHDVKLEKTYAGDIVNGEVIEIKSVEELDKYIQENIQERYREGIEGEIANENNYMKELGSLHAEWNEMGSKRMTEYLDYYADVDNGYDSANFEDYIDYLYVEKNEIDQKQYEYFKESMEEIEQHEQTTNKEIER